MPPRDTGFGLGVSARAVDAPANKPADGHALRSAWQREMERAQAATWFHDPATGAGEGGAPEGHSKAEAPRAEVPRGARGLRPVVLAPAQGATGIAAVHAAILATPPAQPRSVPAAWPAALPQERLRVGQGGSDEVALPSELSQDWRQALRAIAARPAVPFASAATAASDVLQWWASAAPKTSVQVHCESRAEGVIVWLGVQGDESAIAQTAAAVVAELRQAWSGGPQRLTRVVCNGQVVWSAARDGTTVDTVHSSGSDRGSPGISYPKEL